MRPDRRIKEHHTRSAARTVRERSLANMYKNEAVIKLFTKNSFNSAENECYDGNNGVLKMKKHWSYCRHSCNFWLLYLLSLLLICNICGADSDQCARGVRTPGRTWPQGNIILEYGQPLAIYCILNESLMDPRIRGKNSSDLVFFRNEEEMQSQNMIIINETTTVMSIEKPAPSSNLYSCKLKLNDGHTERYETVCLNHVEVGFKPLKPTKFNCTSHNWENLICTWEPAQNTIPTDYSLTFKLPGRARDRLLYACPRPHPEVKLPPNTCLWDQGTNPMYRMVYEYYTFQLNAENVLGRATFFYEFHHWANVIPSKPIDLTQVNKTSASVLLHWKTPYWVKHFPPGLHHRISYRNQWDGLQTWQTKNITVGVHDSEKYFNLTDLQYANTVYDIKVYMKSAKADGEDKWSQPSEITVQTAARRPDSPPRTDIGSFEITGTSSYRNVYIYWQTIPRHLENGENFTYQIVRVEESGRRVDLQPSEITGTHAKFEGLSFNSYKFEIVSTNDEGANEQKAIVFVASQSEMPHEPKAFAKIAFEDGLYELSWDPSNDSDITNYTIFWCENDRDRPYQCSGYLDWVHVPANESVYNVTVPDAAKVYQFAISANTEKASSGMVWAQCTILYNKVAGKMRSVWINRIESNSIELGWKLDCSDRIDTVEAFNIYFCPIVNLYNLTCSSPKMKTTVKAHPHTIRGTANGLNPLTMYKLTVAVLNKNGEGRHSDPLYETTFAPAPTSFRDLLFLTLYNFNKLYHSDRMTIPGNDE